MRTLCRQRFEQFGAAGQARRIRVAPMSEMARRYAAGDLDPRIADSRAA
jgi:fructose-bisphosphate aldolase class II